MNKPALSSLVTVGLAGVAVILATAGPDTLPPILVLSDGATLALRLLGAVGAFVGLRVLLSRGDSARVPGGATATIRSTAIIMVVLAVVAVSTRPPSPVAEAQRTGGPAVPAGWLDFGQSSGPPGAAPGSRGAPSPIQGSRLDGGDAPQLVPGVTATADTSQSLLSRIARPLVPLLILALLAVVAYRAFMRRFTPRTPSWTFSLEQPDGTAVASALEESLDPIAWDMGTPRDQISAAYRRLLHALKAAGASREPWEAPHEHLDRVLSRLGVRFEPLHRLADLYVMAEFGNRPVTDDHRTEARHILEASLSDLRGGATA